MLDTSTMDPMGYLAKNLMGQEVYLSSMNQFGAQGQKLEPNQQYQQWNRCFMPFLNPPT